MDQSLPSHVDILPLALFTVRRQADRPKVYNNHIDTQEKIPYTSAHKKGFSRNKKILDENILFCIIL